MTRRQLLAKAVRRLSMVVAGVSAMQAGTGHAQLPACSALAKEWPGSSASRPVLAEDLATLRDIGRSDTSSDQGPAFDMSPDGKRIAFVVRRADPPTNRYCQSLVVVARDGRSTPVEVARIGDAIRMSLNVRGLWLPQGLMIVNQPKWSPDGRRLAYLGKVAATAQAFVIDLDHHRAVQVTHARSDIEDLSWSPDGRAIVYSTRPQLADEVRAIARDARTGYLYGARTWPLVAAAPLPAPPPLMVRSVDLFSGIDRLADDHERGSLQPPALWTAPTMAAAVSLDADDHAWTEAAMPRQWGSPMRLRAVQRGRPLQCDADPCTGRITDLWVDRATGSYVYARREGWGGSVTSLYRWHPGDAPVRILATEDLLLGCRTGRGELFCGREASLQPRRLVAIDVRTGRERLVFDPNPAFRRLALGPVQRLHWHADLGVEAFGDLVLPPHVDPAQRLPLVVVQYRTRGFLRGAIGDEVPIQALANRGFAVLSVDNTPEYATVAKANVSSFAEAAAVDIKDWAERRLILSSLVAGLHAAEAVAPIDPARIGITGLSDGASTAWFALINTRLFSAASLSSPTWDTATTWPLAGPALQGQLRQLKFPAFANLDPSFWRPASPTMNAALFGAPLLLQYSDDEYLAGMDAVTALQDANRVVELRVYPDELHLKWQPSHRLAVYQQNLDWFAFWLQRREDPDPAKHDQYVRWRALRDQACQPATAGDAIPAVSPQLCNQASTSISSDTLR